MKECSEFEKLILLNSLHKANSLNDLMRKADSKADEYVENLFIKIVRKYTFNALQISFSYHYHSFHIQHCNDIHGLQHLTECLLSAIGLQTKAGYYMQAVSMPEIHSSHGVGRFREYSLKSMGKEEIVQNRKFLLV